MALWLRRHAGLLGLLAAATALKVWLIAAGAVPFNSDEAVVGLMARHILQGQFPVFFYGQAYMGSLDAWLIAGAFRLFGISTLGIRGVQILLYVVYLVSLYLLAKRWTGDRRTAHLAVGLAAIPPIVVTTYTTATLGGYSEVLILGNVALIMTDRLLSTDEAAVIDWLMLGLTGGLAFWTLGLAVVYLLPAAVLLAWRYRFSRLRQYGFAGLAFLLASSPWWIYNWTHHGAALAVLTSGSPMQSTVLQRAVGFLVLGLPALLGWRAPWSPSYLPPVTLAVGILLFCSVGLFTLERVRQRRSAFLAPAQSMLVLFPGTFVLLFVGTQFGIDSTGRYLLPLYAPLAIITATFVAAVFNYRRALGWVVLAGFVGLNLVTTALAANSPDKITTQFDPITRFDNHYDPALIDFLESQGMTRGYSNYWVTFRLAFLTDERVLLAPRLPYKADLRYTSNDDRYPAYTSAVERSPQVVYITTQHPLLNQELAQAMTAAGVGFQETDIGPYHIFYGLSRAVRPPELGF